MPSNQMIVATYQNASDAESSVTALEAAKIGIGALSLVRSYPIREAVGFRKSEGHIYWWGEPDAFWQRYPEAGVFVFPDSKPLLVTGPLAKSIADFEKLSPTSNPRQSALLSGFATFGIPESYLKEYARLIADGSSLLMTGGDDQEVAQIHSVLKNTRSATVEVHRLGDKTVHSNRPVPLTRFIMPSDRRILFPVDFSERSKELLPYVGAVARKFNSEVTLLHVLGPYEGLPSEPEMSFVDWPHYQDRLREKREGELMELAAGAFDNVNVTAVVDSGDPAQKIMHHAAEHHAGLIMMPTHGRGTFRKLLLGSITSKILHDSAYPVWTTAHAETCGTSTGRDIRRVVCALDPASDGRRMLEATSDIASVYGAEVLIVHAISAQAASPEAGMDSGFTQFLSDAATGSIADLQRAAGTKWDVRVDIGNVAAVIRESAMRTQADLVIIGRGCLSETMGALRTHVGAIIRESPCPVLSVSNGPQN